MNQEIRKLPNSELNTHGTWFKDMQKFSRYFLRQLDACHTLEHRPHNRSRPTPT